MVAALDLGSSVKRRGGSSPLIPTTFTIMITYKRFKQIWRSIFKDNDYSPPTKIEKALAAYADGDDSYFKKCGEVEKLVETQQS